MGSTAVEIKEAGVARPVAGFLPIHMPKNTGAGVIIAGLSTVCGMALIWYVWWLAALSFLGIIVATIIHTFNYNRDYHIPAHEVAEVEDAQPATGGLR